MQTKMRKYQFEDDFWSMRDFLRQVFFLNNLHERSWHVARLDYARWHTCLNCANVSLEQVAYLWECDGQLIAFLMPDGGPGEAFFNVHPDLCTPELEAEMLDVAEANLTAVKEDGSRQLVVWCSEFNTLRQELLTRRGYTRQGEAEHQWRRLLDKPIPDVPLAAGYTIRSLGDGLELLERCYASGLGFHQGDIKVAVENRDDPTWYRNIQTAPTYRRDLDLVAVAPDGAIAAFCTIWFDDVTRTGVFEPVATVPSHQRKGLGKAVMHEGLRRLQRMGALVAYVGGYEPGANALYSSVMGPEHDLDEPWIHFFIANA
jgi:GNAT superfamily N-acetyltransferase